LCSKGAALVETLDDTTRLLRPQVNGFDTTWDASLSLIAARFQDAITKHGPDSVAFYVSGQFLTEDYYVANKLMKGFIGSGNIDTNSRLCMSSSVAGHVRAFGEDIVPGTYEDWDQADLVVLVGSNTAWCHPVLFQRLAAARTARGARVVTIDPRRTATSEGADLHLPLALGTDVALFAGLLVHLAEHKGFAQGWIDAHTTGIDAALTAARECAVTPAKVAEMTGLTPEAISTFYDYSQGVNQSSAGADKVNAIINCHLATGRIGRPGMGPFSVTGQPNAMGGREVGGLANQLAAHMTFERAVDIDRVRRFWNAPNLARQPGLKAVDLFDAMLDGRIKAVWIAATNPAASMPRADRVRQALEACPFVVASDCWPTDTTRFASVVLPAATWGEKDGTVTNSERRISRQRTFRRAPGEAMPDWWMFAELGRRMGWDESFSYDGPAKIFNEHAALSCFENDGGRAFDLGGLADLSDADYDRLAPTLWPVPKQGDGNTHDGRLFADGKFQTPDRRARFIATPFRVAAPAPDRRMPFLLNTGRIRDQWHTMTRTGAAPRLMTHQEEPFLELHPDDATRLCVEDGDLVRVETAYAATVLRARPKQDLRVGEIFVPMHWTDAFVAKGPIDRLVGAICDPISGQPGLKATAARLAPVPTLWRGLLFNGARRLESDGFYYAHIPSAQGFVSELRGWEPLPDLPSLSLWAEELLGHPPDGERIDFIDPTCGVYRFASVASGHLRSCLLLAREQRWPLPGRDKIAPLLGYAFDESAYAALFHIEEATDVAVVRDQKICSCFSVGRIAIEQAIATHHLTTRSQISDCVKAGTNCGSCIPEIEEILRDAHAMKERASLATASS
jgi:assimilatory nitrate reductase catalytic subunit